MKGKNPLTGYSWHFEYHTVDKKKAKPANCIYMTEDRICQHKKSQQYLSKCFMASYCSLRVKESGVKHQTENTNTSKKLKIIKIKCSLPLNCQMHSKILGDGEYISYDEDNMLISVQFGKEIKKFAYPDSIINKHLVVSEDILKLVLRDKYHAVKG